MMNKHRPAYTAFTALIAAVILFTMGCSNTLQEPAQSAGDVPAGKGLVQLTIGSGSSRTLIPEVTLSNYDYTFTKSGTDPVTGSIVGGNTGDILLDAGTWDVTVTGFVGGIPLFSGSASATVTGSTQVAVTVVLVPDTFTGAGTFTYSVSLPAGVDTAVLTLDSIVPGYTSGGKNLTANNSGSIPSVPSGYYLVKAELTKAGKSAVKTEVVHIYNGQTTNADYDLSSIGFAYTLSAPTEPTLTPGTGQLTVDWTTITGAASYEVWYGTSNDPSLAAQSGGDITGTTTTITSLTANTTYYVWIRAKNAATISGFSPSASATLVSGSYYTVITSDVDLAKIGLDAGYPLNGKYLLTADISLTNWVPVGTPAAPFTGEFNGNGKTITVDSFDSGFLADTSTVTTDASSYLGTFGYVAGDDIDNRAEIKNLKMVSTVNASSAKKGGLAVGLVAGYAELANIQSITLAGTLDLTTAINTYVGGVVGYAQSGTTVLDCTGSLTITTDGGTGGGLATGMFYGYVGGFVGAFAGTKNLGSGIVGTPGLGEAGNGVEISNCHNTGNIMNISTPSAAQYFLGGIAGGSYYAFTTSYMGTVSYCSSTGDMTSIVGGFWAWAGGIVGCVVGDGDGTWEKTTKVYRCWASGTQKVESQYPYGGGIVGYIYYGALVQECYFTGTVIGNKDGNYSGGIAGYNSQQAGHISRIEDCWSSGTVIGLHNAGGIVGQNQVVATVKNCYSIAAVEVTGTCETNKSSTNPGAGGIAGFNGSSTIPSITGCVALNTRITAADGTKIHRVLGSDITTGTRGNNLGYFGLVPVTGGTYTADKALDGLDGEDCTAKPAQSVYEGLGWDFANVWTMGTNGYPALQWQL
jgi:hypothetical protein